MSEFLILFVYSIVYLTVCISQCISTGTGSISIYRMSWSEQRNLSKQWSTHIIDNMPHVKLTINYINVCIL